MRWNLIFSLDWLTAVLILATSCVACCVSGDVDRSPCLGRLSAHLHQWGHLLELVERQRLETKSYRHVSQAPTRLLQYG